MHVGGNAGCSLRKRPPTARKIISFPISNLVEDEEERDEDGIDYTEKE
jgi:hypothetical protein